MEIAGGVNRPLQWMCSTAASLKPQSSLPLLPRCKSHRPRIRRGALGKKHAALLLSAVDFDNQVSFGRRQIRDVAENAVVGADLRKRKSLAICHQPAANRR